MKHNEKNYRIIIKTKANGEKLYYVQKRCLFFFWIYEKEWDEIEVCVARPIEWHTLEEAEQYIQSDIQYTIKIKNKKIVKREYINYEK